MTDIAQRADIVVGVKSKGGHRFAFYRGLSQISYKLETLSKM